MNIFGINIYLAFRSVLALTLMRQRAWVFVTSWILAQHKTWNIVTVQDIVVELTSDDSLEKNGKLQS